MSNRRGPYRRSSIIVEVPDSDAIPKAQSPDGMEMVSDRTRTHRGRRYRTTQVRFGCARYRRSVDGRHVRWSEWRAGRFQSTVRRAHAERLEQLFQQHFDVDTEEVSHE